MSKVTEIMEKKFGGTFTERVNPVTQSVGTSATQILEPNPDRVAVVIANVGNNDVLIGFNDQVSTSNGIKLVSGTGSLVLEINEDLVLPSLEMFAIGDGGSSTIYTVVIESQG